MNILAFDTATNACSAALQVDGKIYSRHEIAPQQHAKLILPMIQDLLSEAKINLSDLTVIAFGCGPGSFMGVRLATATAQGLGFGLTIPLIPVSTLQTLAQTVIIPFEKGGQFCAAKPGGFIVSGWDARMDEIYWGFYESDENGIMQSKRENALCTPENIDINAFSKVPFKLVGNAWSVYKEKLSPSIFSQASDIQTELYPDAKAMLTIAISKYLNNEIVSPENAHPHYIRHRVVHTQN
ncbi:MAG: tRNA (adenosine(37)-N6)-threonylcarbamoyltransferase complex dimerization subunit type 1 TsaB [Gammaproteobacteria bacterium RIFCSPHIGHO2_12_FULL_38_11]|nr:MAG: tRNA (adenosine(37)-N6)-threonylcarbamoyltransferase complex dimerization subunit type 1 TsaB [Gammaproteobacteria bacterium RIFCSPHIGHO2_12_FULL_38_11]